MVQRLHNAFGHCHAPWADASLAPADPPPKAAGTPKPDSPPPRSRTA
jgi:hypothetical protein